MRPSQPNPGNRGFAITESVVDHAECDQLLEAILASPNARGRAGTRHLMAHQAVAEIAWDARLRLLAWAELGMTAIPYRATLFEKTGQANWLVTWHQDTALPLDRTFDLQGWGPWSKKAGVNYALAPTWALRRVVALRLHLDASTCENGPLRVIPGSHVRGVLADDELTSITAADAGVECPVGRGGVMAMSPLVIHASSKTRSIMPRRVLHIEYTDSLDLGPGIRLAVA